MRRSDGKHHWKFFRAGGVDQVMIRNGEDLTRLEELDQKLWVALAVPTRGIEFDPKSADLLDTDHDGRIRPPELLAAIKWMAGALKDVGEIMTPGDTVELAWIKDPELLACSRRILENLGKADATRISLADVTDTAKVFTATKFNGDGVVPAEAAEDPATRQAIEDIIATLEGVDDRGGKPGVNQANLEAFFTQVAAYDQWAARAPAEAIEGLTPEATTAAAAALAAVKPKVDDYFTRCRLAGYDPRSLGALNREEKEYLAIAAKDLSSTAEELAGFPLAHVEAGRPLPLEERLLNPAWSKAMADFVARAVTPLLGEGRTELTGEEWVALEGRLASCQAWVASKPETKIEKLGSARIHELATGKDREAIAALIAEDLALEKEYAQLASTEKLVRLRRDLYELVTNFVNFADFYGRTGAVFQAGTLILDARSCTLCIEVTDAAKHAALAAMAGAYLAYCDITRPGEKKTIVALFTDGDSDNLMVGRNGVFYDRKGQDWDATITKVVANPISVAEAFWSPYKKFVRLIEQQIAKRAAAADAEANTKVANAAEVAVASDNPTTATAALPAKKFDVGTVAALGVALGSIGTFFGLLLGKFLDLGLWMPIGLVALVLLISGPSMILAWLKLRNRNLGPILDANGWAINTKARMNVPFGAALTQVAALPAGTERSMKDPFVEPRSMWPTYVAALLLLAGATYVLNHQGYLHRWTGGIVGSEPAPAAATAAPAEAPAGSEAPAAPQAAAN